MICISREEMIRQVLNLPPRNLEALLRTISPPTHPLLDGEKQKQVTNGQKDQNPIHEEDEDTSDSDDESVEENTQNCTKTTNERERHDCCLSH